MKKITTNFLLVLVSLVVGVVFVELALRFAYPRYQYAAESQFERNPKRIWARQPNVTYYRQHPDTGVQHLVHHNNFALRQHRNFSENELLSSVNLGFFGDSFAENLRLPSQYSFTEPLDYLLNLGEGTFHTLNFGVDGYGTDQAFLYYQDSPLSKHLDYVFYIFYSNDLRNIYENNIFTLNNAGALMLNPANDSLWWVRLVSSLHITYLFLDVKQRVFESQADQKGPEIDHYFFQEEQQRLQAKRKERFHSPKADAIEADFEEGRESEDLRTTMEIFQALLKRWEQTVENNGGHFFIVLPPSPEIGNYSEIFGDEFQVIDLSKTFKKMDPGFRYADYQFKKDGHWNEQANLLAAVALYRIIEQKAHVSKIPDARLKEELFTYYRACKLGWTPTMWATRVDSPSEKINKIQRTYMAFEYSLLTK